MVIAQDISGYSGRPKYVSGGYTTERIPGIDPGIHFSYKCEFQDPIISKIADCQHVLLRIYSIIE
jgi:hypothetical protein